MNPFTESTVAVPLKTPLRTVLMRSGVCLALLGSAYANTVHAVDVNAATAAQLEGVRGIGPKTAQIIVDERARGGRFESFDDLSDRVKGIGPAKVATLQAAGLTVQGGLAVVSGASQGGGVKPGASTPDNRRESGPLRAVPSRK